MGRGERRPQPRLPAVPLEAVQQRRLLAADVGTRAAVDDDVEVEAAAVDVAAQVPRRVGLAHGGLEPAAGLHELPPQVHEGVVRADGERRDDHAFDQRVRVGHHQRRVLAGARLALVGVHDEVVRLAVVLRDEAPLHAGGEAGAAAPAQARLLDHGDELVGVGAERLTQRAVPARALVGGERPGLGLRPPLREDARLGVVPAAVGADRPRAGLAWGAHGCVSSSGAASCGCPASAVSSSRRGGSATASGVAPPSAGPSTA